MSQQDAAGHRTDDRLNPGILEFLCHGFTKLLSIFRMLQHIELLHIMRAVQTGGQQEMSIHDGIRLDQ